MFKRIITRLLKIPRHIVAYMKIVGIVGSKKGGEWMGPELKF